MDVWRRALHAATAVAIILGIAVGVVTEPGRSDSARANSLDPTTSAPVQWAPAADPIAPAPQATAPVTAAASTTVVEPVTTAPAPLPTATVATAPPPSTAPPPPPTVPFTPQLVARVTVPVMQVYANQGDRQPALALAQNTWFGSPTTLPVSQRAGDWLKVRLPTRPNSSEGWVNASDVALANVVDRVDVDVANRTLVWTHAGSVMLQATVAVGAPSTPTPAGFFFVTDQLPQDPAGPYGGWIVALDAHSEVFSTFEGGDARIAIHGTNDPASIGEATSSGCIRVDASTLSTLARALPLGTPVVVS